MAGGCREGAGRKPGSVNRISMRAMEEAAKTGELPHEFLLRVARGEKVGDHEPSFENRMDAAKAAAPYFAPRLASAKIESSVGGALPDWLDPPPSKSARELTNGQLTVRMLSELARDRDAWERFTVDSEVGKVLCKHVQARLAQLQSEGESSEG